VVLIKKYESEQALSEHSSGRALATCCLRKMASSAEIPMCNFSNRVRPETRKRARC